MNDKQRNEIDESELALQTARLLESGECSDQADAATFELGRLLRQSATHDLPESNEDLRKQLLATLAANGDAPSDVPLVSAKAPLDTMPARTISRRWWMGLAAGALVAACGWWLYQSESSRRQIGLEAFNYHKSVSDEASFNTTPNGQARMGLIYKTETVTEEVPVQKIRTETRTRTLPMQRTRTETKRFQTADGTWKTKQVSVPYTENTTQNYSVQVPYTENKKRTFELKVPYTADGKKIAAADYDKFGVDRKKLTRNSLGGQKLDSLKVAEAASSGPSNNLDSNGVVIGDKVAMGRAYKLKIAKAEVIESYSRQMISDADGDVLAGVVITDGDQQGGEGREAKLGLPGSPVRTSTVVSVPDGGTVLLGGVKRKSNVTPLYLIESQDQDNLDLQFSESNFSSKLKDDSSGEQYAPIYENAFVQATGGAALSTFSIDVDTASYANMRRFLNSGQTPPRDSIRIEELVNYFKYDYPQPKGDDPFSVNMELAGCPWNDSHKLLRVGLKGKDVHVKERPATNVVCLIDVSGSMNSTAKLPLLKRGFQMMVKQLGENDRVSIVTYAGNAGVALEPTTGDNTKKINEAIQRLTPGGSTHGSAGINLAYKLAQQHFITGGVNKVILATDGDLNVGVTADGALVDLIKQKASEGVFLTVLGFGTGNLQDGKLEKLADNGNGHYAYIDSNREAHRVLVQQLSGSLVTIAKDVKIQIEFNPAEVKSYRLVGYENRMLETKDFADDRKDAGEIGAGHTVTAIYEIEPTGGVAAAFVAPHGMKYQDTSTEVATPKDDSQRAKLSDAAESGELATVALRYKQPDENTSKRIEFAIKNQEKSFTSASDDFRFAASVAGFGMLLRGSGHAGTASPQMILEMASQSMGDDTTGYRAEFVDLIRKAFAR